MEGKKGSVSSFGLLTISALELEDSEQEIIPQGNVWGDDSTTSLKDSSCGHHPFSCETFTTVSSVIVLISCLHGCTGDRL